MTTFLRVAVGDISLAKLLDHDDAVAALQAADRAHHRIVIGIEHDNFRPVRYVDAARIGIHRDVVEIFACRPGPRARQPS